ncbi:MAG: LysM peptidoglycan-binding domain-containing protein, partial [Candidatus Adiutrix sp.]
GGSASSSAIGKQAVTIAKETRADSQVKHDLGPQFELQLPLMISQEVVALGGPSYGREGVPMEINRQVLISINYFTTERRSFMINGLSRGSKYIPMMQEIFRQKGLPEDLVYIALIESGFQTKATSHASAVGPWQFIAATGRRYGLTINEWVDERMDPVKSTYAAADYLTALHDMFNSWPLALAAYNSGEGKIKRGMKNYGVSNFWDMANLGGHLAGETKLYVPSFLAAVFIAKDPQAYGLVINKLPADKWDEVVVPNPIDLTVAASLAGTNAARIKELNPHLRKNTTPLNQNNFVLRVPDGSQRKFERAYAKLPKEQRLATVNTSNQGVVHVVKKGEGPVGIARRYGVTTQALKDLNKIKGDTIAVGTKLNIPPIASGVSGQGGRLEGGEIITYTIKAGDTPSGLAANFGQSWADILALNKLPNNYRLIAGKKIQVQQKPVRKTAPAPTTPAAKSAPFGGTSESAPAIAPAPTGQTHTVAAGETLGAIGQKYKVSVKAISEANGLKTATIKVGQKLKIPSTNAAPTAVVSPPKAAPSPAPTAVVSQPKAAASPPKGSGAVDLRHTVVSGETLYSVATKYKLSVEELKGLNPSISGTLLRTGQKLTVQKPSPPPKAAPKTYKAQEGETLYRIAVKHNISVETLKKLNNLTGDYLRAGQTLKVSD